MRAFKTAGVVGWIVLASAALAQAPAQGPVELVTDAAIDTLTVGQRFHVAYRFSYPDSLTPIVPEQLDAGTCRALLVQWSETTDANRVTRVADVTFIPVDIDSAVVPSNVFQFLAPSGDTLAVASDEIPVPIRRIADKSEGARPLKEQWAPPPNYLKWALIALGVIAAVALLVWWIRRRRARRAAIIAPEVRLPPEAIAFMELDRIAGLDLPGRGEFKTHYTLVVDVVRHYLEARYGVLAMDRTTWELLGDLAARDVRIDGLSVLLEEADLVKFAKHVPAREDASRAIERAREIVRATTPRAEPLPAADVSPASEVP